MFSRQKAVCYRNVFAHLFRRQGCLKSLSLSARALRCSAHTSAVVVAVKYIRTYVLYEITHMTEAFILAGDTSWLITLTLVPSLMHFWVLLLSHCSVPREEVWERTAGTQRHLAGRGARLSQRGAKSAQQSASEGLHDRKWAGDYALSMLVSTKQSKVDFPQLQKTEQSVC